MIDIQLLAQIISILGMVFIICSFQFKSNTWLYVFQLTGCLLFAASYYLLGRISGAVANLIGVARCLVLLVKKFKGKILTLILMEIVSLALLIWVYEDYTSIIMIVTQIVLNFALWTNNGKIIRYANLFCASPLWLIYNIIVFSIGGIITESFNLISILVALIRYRKSGFTK